MYSPTQLVLKYIQYFLSASNSKGHGIHSPFVFDLITKVFNDKKKYREYELIEQLRKQLLEDTNEIEVQDFGAGSAKGLKKSRTVGQIAATSLKKPKYAQLLYRLVNYFQPQQILELGTSLGITTAYLATVNKTAQVITMEGSLAIASLAEKNFQELLLNNIQVVRGNFDDTLKSAINQQPLLNFVFIDGNHRKEPTLSYFQQLLPKSNNETVFVFDDIHWSRDMEEAWEAIKQHPSVTVTVDLFFIGLVFLRKEQKEKQHFVVRF